MVVVVQVFAWYIVLRNLVSDYFCHIWIARIFDTVYGVRFERIAFFCQLLHTLRICKRCVRNLLSRSSLSGGARPRFDALFSFTLRHIFSFWLHVLPLSLAHDATSESTKGAFLVD